VTAEIEPTSLRALLDRVLVKAGSPDWVELGVLRAGPLDVEALARQFNKAAEDVGSDLRIKAPEAQEGEEAK
jgi:hypothetical protein